MPLKVSISSVEWCFFTRYGRKVDFFSIECRKADIIVQNIEWSQIFLIKKESKVFQWCLSSQCNCSVAEMLVFGHFYRWFMAKIWFGKNQLKSAPGCQVELLLHMARQRCVRLSFLSSEVPFYRESVVFIVIY